MRFVIVALFMVLASSVGAQEVGHPALRGEQEPAGQQQEKTAPARQEDAAPEQDGATRLLPSIQGIKVAIRDLIAEEDKISAEEERRRDQADLKAQESMALWAFWMFIAAAASVILTGVGVVLIWRTLLHTRDAAIHAGRAVDEAKNATKAAQDAVTVTQNLGEAQIRAYLYCASGEFTRDKDCISATIEIGNSGNSPALGVKIRGDLGVHDVVGRPEMTRVVGWAQSRESETECQPIIAGGKMNETLTFFWDFDFLTNIEDDSDIEFKHNVFLEGNEIAFDVKVDWLDVFGKKNDFFVRLHAIVGPHPNAPKMVSKRKGVLKLRMESMRHRVVPQVDEE